MNFSISNSISLGAHGGMIIRNGSQTIKMGRGGMVIENPSGQQIVMDNSGIHIYNRNSHVFVNSNSPNGNINIQTSFRNQNYSFESEEYSNSTSTNTSYEEPVSTPREEHQTSGFNYRITNNNMVWHSSQRGTLPELSSNHYEHHHRQEQAKKQGLTKAQINQLPVNLYNGKAKKLKIAQEKRSGKKVSESYEPSSNDSCAICILDYKLGDKLKTMPCLHKFHKNCIDKWLAMKSDCPICKYDILG